MLYGGRVSELLTIDDLAELAEAATWSDDPRAIAAELVAAVDEQRLADAEDACHALHLAAEIMHSVEERDAALALSARAVSLAPAVPADAGPIRAGYAERLFLAGRDDEAMAELTAIRPALNLDPDTIENVAVVLVEADRAALAHEWLSEALATQRAVAGPDAADDELDVFHQLQYERYHVRRVLQLPMDADDEMAQLLQEMAEDMQVGLVFWPSPEFDELDPALAAPHRAGGCGLGRAPRHRRVHHDRAGRRHGLGARPRRRHRHRAGRVRGRAGTATRATPR